MAQLAGRAFSKMLKYFEVMLNIFKVSCEKKLRDLDWSWQISFRESASLIFLLGQ